MVDTDYGIRQKIVDIAKYIGDLIHEDNTEFKRTLKDAGTIGALINIGIDLYTKIQEERQTGEEKAFNSLFKIIFKAAKESISNINIDKISINNEKNNKLKEDLFKVFTKKKDWNNYLPNHPTVVEFRKFICSILKNENYNNLIRDFIFKFNIVLDNITDDNNDPEIIQFRRWSSRNQNTKNLIEHLEYSRSIIYTISPGDNRYLAEYYLENYAILADVNTTWDKEDSYFIHYNDNYNYLNEKYGGKEKKAITLVNEYVKNSTKKYLIIGAPFGIGKTSLSLNITAFLASVYLDDPENIENNYIPIFVPLKGKLEIIDESDSSLEDKLHQIAPRESGKNKKILLICDGLDEYGEDIEMLRQKLDRIRERYPFMQIIITTRLAAGIPYKLGNISSYIRLLPFNNKQINAFFQSYGLPEINHQFLKRYRLKDEEISKPLFCWMFAIMNNSGFYNDMLRESTDQLMTRALIYEGFIHSIIRGKHRSIADQLNITQYYNDEKRILRKIAAVRQMNEPRILTRNKVIEQLEYYYGLQNSNVYLQEHIIEPILSSYFYLQGSTTDDKTIDFIHKSFREYLLAEYYIESIVNDKIHYLNVGIPTYETILFLDGLLEILLFKEYDEKLRDFIDTFFPIGERGQITKLTLLSKLKKNAQACFESEQIIYHSEEQSFPNNNAWNLSELSISKYPSLLVHRWIALFILNKITPGITIEKNFLVEFIVKTIHNIPVWLRMLSKFKLSGSNLSRVDLSEANLSEANLSEANLSEANLSGANLSKAYLKGADLSRAILSGADLSRANLSEANLSNAYLSGTILTNAHLLESNLTDANLSGANLFLANLHDANLSGANLSRANLSRARLSRSTLIRSNLSNVNFYYANLSGADLSNADLSNADLSESKLSGANLTRADLSNANLSNANLSNTNINRAINLPISNTEAKERGAIV